MNLAVIGQTGECFSCARLSQCSTTDLTKVMGDFTCPMYLPVAEPIYEARYVVVKQYGLYQAVRAMLGDPELEKEE